MKRLANQRKAHRASKRARSIQRHVQRARVEAQSSEPLLGLMLRMVRPSPEPIARDEARLLVLGASTYPSGFQSDAPVEFLSALARLWPTTAAPPVFWSRTDANPMGVHMRSGGAAARANVARDILHTAPGRAFELLSAADRWEPVRDNAPYTRAPVSLTCSVYHRSSDPRAVFELHYAVGGVSGRAVQFTDDGAPYTDGWGCLMQFDVQGTANAHEWYRRWAAMLDEHSAAIKARLCHSLHDGFDGYTGLFHLFNVEVLLRAGLTVVPTPVERAEFVRVLADAVSAREFKVLAAVIGGGVKGHRALVEARLRQIQHPLFIEATT